MGTLFATLKAMIAGADVVMVTSAVYRDGPDVIRKLVDSVRRYLEFHHHSTLHDFLQSRMTFDAGPEQMMRLEFVDPLTRSKTYLDPTPTVTPTVGKAYGHMRG